jgi:type II secretory pathway pseudopilin PulG
MARPPSSWVGEPRARARGPRRGRPGGDPSGYSLVELLLVLGTVGIVLAIAVPVLERAADTADAAAAARYVAGVVARARFDAARAQRARAVRFSPMPGAVFTVVADGDGDGVNAADVTTGIDPVVRVADRLADHFPRARFGLAGAMPAIDEAGLLSSDDDPIRLGSADQLTLSPLGTATSGTLYIASRAGAQFAVRVAGVTGRARVLRYDPGTRAWRAY